MVLLALDKEQPNGLGQLEVIVDICQATFELGSRLGDGLKVGE